MSNMHDPKLSIIVPVYNSAKYLQRCLASICGQTLREIEIICIDDGSTDDSLKILKEFADRDSRIILIVNKENEGNTSSRNKGLKQATAPYIGFVDSDDFIAPDMYEILYSAMITNNVDFVECGAAPSFDYIRYDPASMINGCLTHLSGKVNDPVKFSTTTGVIWKILYKKEIISKYNIKFEKGKAFDDSAFVFSYKVFAQNGFYIQDNLYIYSCHEDSLMGKVHSNKYEESNLDILETIKVFYSFLQTHRIFERFKDVFWYYFESQISFLYKVAAPKVIRTKGIKAIKELLENKDILNLIDKKNRKYRKFLTLNENELMNLSFLYETEYLQLQPTVKLSIKKIIKCLLPYGIVRLIQKGRKN